MAKKAQPRKRTGASETSRTATKKGPVAKKGPAKKKSPGRKKSPGKKRAVRKKVASGAGASRAAEARRKKHLRAVGLYEQALEALQRKELKVAARRFEKVINAFPEERELHERSRRYLQVCERSTTPAPAPQSLEERVYAATLALNAGSEQEALEHLESAVAEAPDSEQVQYMLAVARAAAGDETTAVTHLLRAIELNPDNRFLARHEPIFEILHEDEAFKRLLTCTDGADSRPGR